MRPATPSQFDPQVIQTQAGTTTTATAAVPATTIVEIREAIDQSSTLPPTSSTPSYVTRIFNQPVLLRSATFVVKLDSPDKNATVTIGSIKAVADATGQYYTFGSTPPTTPPAGRQVVRFETTPVPTKGVLALEVIVPTSSGLIAPTFTQVSNGKYVDPISSTPYTSATPAAPLPIYGRYLQVFGQDAPSNEEYFDFYLYVLDGTDYALKGLIANPELAIDPAARTWSAIVQLPDDLPLNKTVKVFAVADPADNQKFSDPLTVSRQPIAYVKGKVPTITTISLPGTPPTDHTKATAITPRTTSTNAAFYANQTKLYFSGTGALPNTCILIAIDSNLSPIAHTGVLATVDSSGTWATSILSSAIQDKQTHTVRASMAQGDQPLQFSDPLSVMVNTQGPTLDSVGIGDSQTIGGYLVTVRFKANGVAFDTPVAQTVSNYSLVPSNGTGIFDPKGKIVPDLASYNPTSNTVTLTFKTLPANDYQFQLALNSAGTQSNLLDVYGNPVSGPLNYPLTKNVDAGGDQAGVIPRAEKAPNAVFPEFNNPRKETNGFNPSDHVDTRVARLYYYRDARRVAEIINRDLKSYNQSAVDTRRRLAEKARNSADTLTDARRQQEVKAVRAAQATREAQRKLDQAQANQQQSQAAANSVQSLTSRQANIQSQLSAAQTAATPAAPAPTATGAAPLPPVPLTDTQAAAAKTAASLQTMLDNNTQQLAQAQQASSTAGDPAAAAQAVQSALDGVQTARAAEVEASDATLQDQAQEDRAREGQFRLEVAAAQEDPNSYVPGQPDSIDPVLQVSISVIGEGVLQLRGPIKGINIIRRMINEIDTPAGQVRIALHTVQINGEHEKRMEKVASRIQYYVDHARFLTVQSAQILRNAVVKVASQKAALACSEPLPDKVTDPDRYAASQEARDRKYQEAFFGTDFINELHDIDAEFLHTSNKLLSLNSMDTTSLASALFLLALAKNDTRLEILQVFEADLAGKLPTAEQNYTLAAGRTGKECPKINPMAQNARFQSFLGFFNAEVDGNDTLNPLQREFIKLAQILKSRLVTELEYNQRFKERGLIEDRLGNYQQELQQQKDREDKAKALREKNRATVELARTRMVARLDAIEKIVSSDRDDLKYFTANIERTRRTIDRIVNARENQQGLIRVVLTEAAKPGNLNGLKVDDSVGSLKIPGRAVGVPVRNSSEAEKFLILLSTPILPKTPTEVNYEVERLQMLEYYFYQIQDVDSIGFTYSLDGVNKHFFLQSGGKIVPDTKGGTTADDLTNATSQLYAMIDQDSSLASLASQFQLSAPQRVQATNAGLLQQHLLEDKLTKNAAGGISNSPLTLHIIFDYAQMLAYYSGVVVDVQSKLEKLTNYTGDISDKLAFDSVSPVTVQQNWRKIKSVLQNNLAGDYLNTAQPLIDEVDTYFRSTVDSYAAYVNAEKIAQESRQPLDAKKMLDGLMDEIEEKYIELLEGTRAHTANIDGYVKAIATALDDDLNTQFYYPAFTEIRKSSTFYDVTLGQVETTNILTNNRMFAKVEPQATMEFDLPKRDILINEAMNGAKATMDSFGALVNDPSFLALAKLKSGQPTSSPAQGFGGASTVRNVLPGLPRSNDESLLSQSPAGNKQFGSALEALIPDPAIYKFEAGTGFEIRPVIQPDGQAVVFHLDYMYTTNIREPVRADEKHLGRIKRHFVDTEVQLGNYELREVSRYTLALKAARTSKGVPLFEDIPGLGVLFRPLPSASSSLQQNVILSQATIFPTLFDLMGLRIAPAVADLDTLATRDAEFVARGRARDVSNRVFDYSTSRVDEYLRVPPAERRSDLYRSQQTIPNRHPSGYEGPGLGLKDSPLQEGYDPTRANPPSGYTPLNSREVIVPGTEPSTPTLMMPSTSATIRRDPNAAKASLTAPAPAGLRAAPVMRTQGKPQPLPPLPTTPSVSPRPTPSARPAQRTPAVAPTVKPAGSTAGAIVPAAPAPPARGIRGLFSKTPKPVPDPTANP